MNFTATLADADGGAQDEVLEGLLADPLFNEFDPQYWISGEDKVNWMGRFAIDAFPILVKYYLGEELDKLVEGHQLLRDLAIPSKRSEAALLFHQDSAHNLTVLDAFAKLQFLKIWGTAFMQESPTCCICYEMFKILNQPPKLNGKAKAVGPKKYDHYGTMLSNHMKFPKDQMLEDEMQQEFRGTWSMFVRRNDEELSTIEWTDLDVQRPWVDRVNNKLWRDAMTTFLETESTTDDAHVTYWGSAPRIPFWGPKDVAESWARIKDPQLSRRGLEPMFSELFTYWTRASAHIYTPPLEYRWHSQRWTGFSENIWSFCLAAGCPKADRKDPFKSLDALRHLLSQQLVYTADLHDRISALNKQIILQQRMITALAYRDVLENLSATTAGHNATAKLHNFLDKIFTAVQGHGKIPAGNPFHDLFAPGNLDKKYEFEQLAQMAKELHATLSRTIHHVQPAKDFDPYVPLPGQFDPMQIAFLAAMKPTRFHKDGTPDWEQERVRYPGQAVEVDIVKIAEALQLATPPKGRAVTLAQEEEAGRAFASRSRRNNNNGAEGSKIVGCASGPSMNGILDDIDSKWDNEDTNKEQMIRFSNRSSDSNSNSASDSGYDIRCYRR